MFGAELWAPGFENPSIADPSSDGTRKFGILNVAGPIASDPKLSVARQSGILFVWGQ